jgi:hypothetical protein
MSVIEVYRGDGLRPGTPIVETLLSNDALLARGIAEMDRSAHAVNQVEMEVVFRPGLRLGQLIEANDPASPTPYRAKITGIHIVISEALIETRLTLEQPR